MVGGKWGIGVALLLLLTLALPRLAGANEAGASDWVTSEQGRVRLISAVTAGGESGSVQLGVQFELQPDWKIYWRSPGDAGYPPALDWKGSDNLADAVMTWPAPHRFSISGLETMGYKQEVVLPVVARLAEPRQKLALRAAIDYLTCAVVCVPQHADLSLTLPKGAGVATPFAHLIGQYLAKVPGAGALQGLSLLSAKANQAGELTVVVAADPPFQDPDMFLERADQMQFGRPSVRLEKGGRTAIFKTKAVQGTGDAGLSEKPVVLTVVDGDRGMEVVTDVMPPEPGIRLPRLLAMLGVALLGGLVLNLMPCVLPVLSLKILALISHGGGEKRTVRGSFLATAAGIVLSFLVLAAATSMVRAAGAAVGWGIQFQQPLFLCLMIALVTLFAANLFGLFEIPLPRVFADFGGGHPAAQGMAGHFATGVFATLLATPCTAPFLGTAVGFALAHGTVEIFAIFLVLGIGMALPYLAVAAWPQAAQMLPRPGRWMVTARALLGVLLLASGIWLLGVLVTVLGPAVAAAMAGAMTLALLLLLLTHLFAWRARTAVIAATLLAAIGLSFLGSAPAADDHKMAQKGLWKPFDRTALAAAVAAGHVVFVDVTADWCLTCQVNKAAVVYRGTVAKRLADPKLLAMQADWTRPDDNIANYLAGFGRYGIPFDAVYGPGAPDGLALPELLSEEAVLQALDQAAKPAS